MQQPLLAGRAPATLIVLGVVVNAAVDVLLPPSRPCTRSVQIPGKAGPSDNQPPIQKEITMENDNLAHRARPNIVLCLTVALSLLIVAACGGPSVASLDPGNTPTDTAKAYIGAMESEDAAHLQLLMTLEARQRAVLGGGIADMFVKLQQTAGAPIKGQGRILKLNEFGATATVDVVVVDDNKCAQCRPDKFAPDWAPPGSAAVPLSLTMQKETAGTWLVSNVTVSDFYTSQIQATQTAVAVATHFYTSQIQANQTAVAVATQAAPTPVPSYTTAKAAYAKAGIADALKKWSSDAILFRVFDQIAESEWPFEYNPGNYIASDHSSHPYSAGDGTSRQWLFYAASPSNKKVMVLRVLDGVVDRQDVSAAYFTTMFGAKQITPGVVDISAYIDSDQAVKIARQHGYQLRDLSNMSIQLSAEDPHDNDQDFKVGVPNWAVFGDDSKEISIDPKTEQIIQNEF